MTQRPTRSLTCTRILSCPTLCNPTDCSPPGSSVHGITQARTREWVPVPSSKGSSWPKDRTQVSCIAGGFFAMWATEEGPCVLHDNVLNVYSLNKPTEPSIYSACCLYHSRSLLQARTESPLYASHTRPCMMKGLHHHRSRGARHPPSITSPVPAFPAHKAPAHLSAKMGPSQRGGVSEPDRKLPSATVFPEHRPEGSTLLNNYFLFFISPPSH